MNKFSSLKNLTWISGNLREIPSVIYEVSTLKELSLSKNRITHISPEIAKLKNLKNLKL